MNGKYASFGNLILLFSRQASIIRRVIKTCKQDKKNTRCPIFYFFFFEIFVFSSQNFQDHDGKKSLSMLE